MRNLYRLCLLFALVLVVIPQAMWAQDISLQPITFDNGVIINITEISVSGERLAVKFTPVTQQLAITSASGLTPHDPLTGERGAHLIDGVFDSYQFTQDEHQLYFSNTSGISAVGSKRWKAKL